MGSWGPRHRPCLGHPAAHSVHSAPLPSRHEHDAARRSRTPRTQPHRPPGGPEWSGHPEPRPEPAISQSSNHPDVVSARQRSGAGTDRRAPPGRCRNQDARAARMWAMCRPSAAQPCPWSEICTAPEHGTWSRSGLPAGGVDRDLTQIPGRLRIWVPRGDKHVSMRTIPRVSNGCAADGDRSMSSSSHGGSGEVRSRGGGGGVGVGRAVGRSGLGSTGGGSGGRCLTQARVLIAGWVTPCPCGIFG